MIDQAVNDRELLLQIACLLENHPWNLATLVMITTLLRAYGFTIRDAPT